MKSIRHHQQQQKLQHNIMRAQQGHTQVEGGTLYLFENHRNHDLSLPRKSFDGKTLIPPRGRFRGDSYFLMMLQIITPFLFEKVYVRKMSLFSF